MNAPEVRDIIYFLVISFLSHCLSGDILDSPFSQLTHLLARGGVVPVRVHTNAERGFIIGIVNQLSNAAGRLLVWNLHLEPCVAPQHQSGTLS